MINEKGILGLGLIICWGCNILHLASSWVLVLMVAPVGIVVFGGIGLVQLVYIIPLCLHFKRKGQTNVMKGLIIAASITALLNVGCWTQFRVGG
jgi:uncharacterized membrane protein YesL